jgi:hypothetical protein
MSILALFLNVKAQVGSTPADWSLDRCEKPAFTPVLENACDSLSNLTIDIIINQFANPSDVTFLSNVTGWNIVNGTISNLNTEQHIISQERNNASSHSNT